MISTIKNAVLIKRLIIYVIVVLFLVINNLLFDYDSHFNGFIQVLILMLLLIDILFHIIMIFKDFNYFKLFLVLENIIIKTMLVTVFIRVNKYVVFDLDITMQTFYTINSLGLFFYVVFVVGFFIRTYYTNNMMIEKYLLLILLNGVFLFSTMFYIDVDFVEIGYVIQVTNFTFSHLTLIVYFPFVILSFLYSFNLNKKKKIIEI